MPITFSKKKAPPLSPQGVKVATPQKYKRIYDLGDERRSVINTLFFEGKPVTEIIKVLQEDWGEFTDVKEGTLTKFLYRYKWDVIDKGLVVRAELMQDRTKAVILAEVSKEFDVLQEVAELITVQKTRVSKLLTREKDMPMLFNSLGGEMKTLSGFVQQYADISFDLGLLKRVPKVTKVSLEKDIPTMESEGKDHVAFNLENSAQIEAAAKEFFRVLEADTEVEHEIQSL